MFHNFLRFIYARKFPELESLVTIPYDYARAVQRLENAASRDQINLSDFLSNHLVVAVKIAFQQGRQKELSPHDKANCLKAADYLLFLESSKHKVGISSYLSF